MARRKKNEDFDDVLAELTSKDGVLLDDLGESKYFVDTGNLAFNYINSGRFIGGGIPGGKITEIFGPPASAKSLLGMAILSGAQKLGGYAIFLDCERAANRDFAISAGHVDPKRLVVYEPPHLEAAFLKIYSVIDKIRAKKGPEVPIVFVYDSIGASPSEREFRETNLPEDYTQADWKRIVGNKEQPGERAKVCSKEFRKLVNVLDTQNATLFVINQLRNKIGVMFGDPSTTAGGGEALKYYASNRNRATPQKRIENTKLEIPIGVNIKLKNEKCRTFSPFWKTEGIQLYFNSGINPLGGLLTILVQSERVEPKSAGNYVVKEPYAEGREIKFKASKARNDVPIELLFDCPKLVDVDTPEEVEAYLKTFGDAIDLSNSSVVKESDLNENGEDVPQDSDIGTFFEEDEEDQEDEQ